MPGTEGPGALVLLPAGRPRDGAHTGPDRGGPEVCRVLLWPKVPSAPTLGRPMGFFCGGGGEWHMTEHHPCRAPSLGTVCRVLTQGHTAQQHIRTQTSFTGPRGSVLPRKNWGAGAEGQDALHDPTCLVQGRIAMGDQKAQMHSELKVAWLRWFRSGSKSVPRSRYGQGLTLSSHVGQTLDS